jgi:hypothetical protein
MDSVLFAVCTVYAFVNAIAMSRLNVSDELGTGEVSALVDSIYATRTAQFGSSPRVSVPAAALDPQLAPEPSLAAYAPAPGECCFSVLSIPRKSSFQLKGFTTPFHPGHALLCCRSTRHLSTDVKFTLLPGWIGPWHRIGNGERTSIFRVSLPLLLKCVQ